MINNPPDLQAKTIGPKINSCSQFIHHPAILATIITAPLVTQKQRKWHIIGHQNKGHAK
jgi:hypothetical protein